MMSDAQHAEWLSLLDISGPFLSPPVLDRVFPQGLEAADPDHSAKLRLAYEEWAEEQQKPHPDPAIHDAWIRLVLIETLGFTPEVLLEGGGIPTDLASTSPEHGETVRPDFVAFDPEDEPGTRRPRLLISVWPPHTELDQPIEDSRWTASPIDRMVALCRSEGVGLRLGLVTNGERWAFVDAPVGETSAHASWYANLWGSEPLTLRAFRSLLGLRRFFGVAESDRLDAMLVESANCQTDVTDQLGFQVRRAVEVLVQAIDRADADTGRTLLADTDPARIYEAALTVMMRLVFLFSAEERGLLRLGDPLYDQFYAVSTLRAQLREAADQVGEEVLERRQDAWSRLLGTFRAIFGGIHHEELQIIPYGSSLFDPDRFPFLEGRAEDTRWPDAESVPLPIDNRTVLLLLESLQLLDLGPGKGARKLSFRALGIEQIGHVYETLLDHSAYRATEPLVSLQGNKGLEPEIPVSNLHDLVLQDDDEALVEFLKAELKKGVAPIRRSLEKSPEPETVARLRSACGGDDVLLAKLLPFHDLIRLDPWGDPVVIREGAVFVTAGEDRRSTGTHYTPRALTEEIVQYALEPVVYRGPAEGKDRNGWELKSPEEILDLKICDPAMGSGAFLVQACRYLSERLVEAWELTAQTSVDTRKGDPISTDPEERLSLARRLVADRCLYGVDVNPLAVEMAKLSMWLITLAKVTPFSFLDHSLRCGDSLLGIESLDQIRYFHSDPQRGREVHQTLFDPTGQFDAVIARARNSRVELESFVVSDIYDFERKKKLLVAADSDVARLRLVATRLIESLVGSGGIPNDAELQELARQLAEKVLDDHASPARLGVSATTLQGQGTVRFFHWPLEFPEVFLRSGRGFDAIVMNPPFVGNKYWKSRIGTYAQSLARLLLRATPGKIDWAVVFHRRAFELLSDSGIMGLLGSTSIAEGESIPVCYGHIANAGTVFRAERSFRWPGTANVHVCIVWTARSQWEDEPILNGEEVDAIGPALGPISTDAFDSTPTVLDGGIWAFEGVHNGRGQAFVLEPANDWFSALEADRSAMFRPYVTGDDITSHGLVDPRRWCVYTGDRSLDEVQTESRLVMEYLDSVVKPTRTTEDLASYKGLAERWWQFWNTRGELYFELEDVESVLVLPKVSKYIVVCRAAPDWVYTNKVVVIREDRADLLSICLSSPFVTWMTRYSGRMGKTTIAVSLSKALFTFALPEGDLGPDASVGVEWQSLAQDWMAENGVGYTQLLNHVHDPDSGDPIAPRMRQLIAENDAAVLAAYGWSDIVQDYDFRDEGLGQRFALVRSSEDQALGRLLRLNHSRSAESALNSRISVSRGTTSPASTLFDA